MKHPPYHHLVQSLSLLCLGLGPTKTCVGAAQSLFEIGNENDYIEPRIVGGSEADIGRYSYAVFLEGPDEYGNMVHYCGGSLIAWDVVLTAAHCQGFTTATVGRHDRNYGTDDEVFSSFKDEVVHPLYYQFEPGIDYDVMLVFLENAYTGDDVVTVRLNSDPSVPYVGQHLTVVGWGDTDARPENEFLFYSDVLMNVDVSVISNEECAASEGYSDYGYYQSFKHVITDRMLCADTYQEDFCFGDSGGPLVADGGDAGSDVQVGIVSWAAGCEDPLPSGFARVSELYDWIQSNVCTGSDYASDAGFDCSDGSDGIFQPVNPCRICPYGTTVELDFVPYDYSTWSCRDAIDIAANYETGSYECAHASQWEFKCCFTTENPCIICADGATVGDEYTPFADFQDDRTCRELIDWAMNFEIGSDYCDVFGERHELYCCHPTDNTPIPTDATTPQPTYFPPLTSPPIGIPTSMPTWVSVTTPQPTVISPSTSPPIIGVRTSMPTNLVSSESSCTVCDGDFREDIVVPMRDVSGLTCEDVVLDETSVDCGSRQYAEALCCPSVASTCSICKGTKLLADVEVVYESGGTWTCRQVAYDAAQYEATSADCASHHDYEEYCCPDVFVPSKPSTSNPPIGFPTSQPTNFVSSETSCKVCDGDFRKDMVVPIPDVLGLTCEGIIVDAETTAETSDICASLQYAEALCCPSAASTCSICKGTKLFADVEVVDENGATWTCGQVAYDAAQYDATSEDCASRHYYEEYCCPDVFITSAPSSSDPPIGFPTPQPTYFVSSETTCKVCNGDFREDIVVPIPDVLGLTCEGIIVDAETTAETSDICAGLQYAEALCCPSAATTCSICKGTKLFADVEVVDENGATWTCGQLAYDAARYEPTSADCASHHDYEEYCCPDVYISTPSTTSPTSSVSSGVPCQVCDGDVRQGIIVPIPDVTGKTCEDIVDSAWTIDEATDVCAGLQYVEALCCPSAASTCSICKGTKLLADVEVSDWTGATRNCVQIAFDAAEYEATSVDCVDHQHSYEVYCCQDDETHPSSSSIKPPQIPSFFSDPSLSTSETLASIFSTPPIEEPKEHMGYESRITSRSATGASESLLVACTSAGAVIMSYFILS